MNQTRRQQHREWLEYEISLYRSKPVNVADLEMAERLERELAELDKLA